MQKSIWLVMGAFLVLSTPAQAQLHKCTDQNGKVSYSDTPCTGSNAKEQTINVKTAPMTSSGATGSTSAKSAKNATPEWQARESEFKKRWKERSEKEAQEQARAANATTTAQGKTDQQVSAECEANRGVNCKSKWAIEKKRLEDTPITDAERQQAIRDRKMGM